MVTQSDPVEDWRRELRAMHKEVIDRLSLLGEGLTANNQALAGEMRAMFSTVISRLTAIENRLPVPRRRKVQIEPTSVQTKFVIRERWPMLSDSAT